MRARSVLCLVAVGMLAFSGTAFGQANLTLQPVSASGTMGVDWELGPGATEITLAAGGQTVAFDMLISGWNSTGMTTYQATLDCTTFSSGKQGTLFPVLLLCDDAQPGEACQGVLSSRGDWVFSGFTGINACDINTTCPDGSPGRIRCGSTLLAGSKADDGGTYYAASFATDISANAHGTFEFTLDTAPDLTFITLADTTNISPAITSGFITVTTGSCCDVFGAPGENGLGCVNNVTLSECLALGAAGAGKWHEGQDCADTDNLISGIDDSCPQCATNADCTEATACEEGICTPAGCVYNDITTPGFCCNPTNGVELLIDDSDPCTTDTCDAGTGVVSHEIAPGNACDDGNGCTVLDECQADGSCLGVDANEQFCDEVTPCLAGACNLDTNLCECSLTTDLILTIDPSELPDGNCFDAGDTITVNVDMGAGSEVVTGGQFLITYDPSCMAYAGDMVTNELFPTVLFHDWDNAAGTIFAAVGVAIMPPGAGTQGPDTMVSFNFTKLGDCGECNLCFDSQNPANTILSNDEGNPVPIELICSKNVRLNGDVSLDVPGNADVNPDCDMPTAVITWDSVTASDTCDVEAPAIDCVATHDGGVDIDHLIANGGEFPQGRSIFECTATNSCGDTDFRYWTVDVSDQHTMDVVVQLSPTIAGDPITRCICFEFYSDCVQAANVWCDELVFGFPYDFIGHNTTVQKVDKGQFACLTAKDPLHTLRSVSDIECVDNQLVAVFKGDPFFGGNWLIGGNLDSWKAGGNADVIDILDFGMFVSQYGLALDPNTSCEMAQAHADINGDGMVDALDFTFISQNFLASSKNSCCENGGANVADTAITAISVKDLRRRGLGELAVADLNADGMLDQADMAAFMAGQVPSIGTKSTRGVRGTLGR